MPSDAGDGEKGMSILERIVARKREELEELKVKIPLEDLMDRIGLEGGWKVVDFEGRLRQNIVGGMAIIAEIKRASPSKGDIAVDLDVVEQGLKYAGAGVDVISCLTESHWFKGSLDDMSRLSAALNNTFPASIRPAVLRKDFIVDSYQIYESRAFGADTILLIVAALDDKQLVDYLSLARSLGMEPLVEVNNADEVQRILNLREIHQTLYPDQKPLEPPKVIGINNRCLHTFHVDLKTTEYLIQYLKHLDSLIISLSGMQDKKDLDYFESIGANGVLIGESLMRAKNPALFIFRLRSAQFPVIIKKICGIRNEKIALETAKLGADLIGLVFAPKSKRRVTIDEAKKIVGCIWDYRGYSRVAPFSSGLPSGLDLTNTCAWFHRQAYEVRKVLSRVRPLIVGVFSDLTLEEINCIRSQVPMDIVQLCDSRVVPAQVDAFTIRTVHLDPSSITSQVLSNIEPAHLILVDSRNDVMAGGTGKTCNWHVASEMAQNLPIILAGGLTPKNVDEALNSIAPFGVDVSSGVESSPGIKDIRLIHSFFTQISTNQSRC